MATTLIQQAARSIDPSFVAQVGAAIDRDTPDMLGASGGFWSGLVADADPTKQADKTARLRGFAQTCVEDRARVVAKVARMLAGVPLIIAVDVAGGTVDANTYVVTDSIVITQCRQTCKTLVGI